MNENLKYGLFFLGGIALGALGAVAVSKGSLKPLATDLLSRGIDAKNAMLSKVEVMKENVEDLMAEAQHVSEQRKVTTED